MAENNEDKPSFRDLSLYVKPSDLGFYGQIYLITNQVNGKKYVGQTVKTLDHRFRQHSVKDTKERSPMAIRRAIRKYGKEKFTIVRLCFAKSVEELSTVENQYILMYNTMQYDLGYNRRSGGSRYPVSEQSRALISKANKGRKHSKEFCEHRSQLVSGEGNPFFGRKHSKETLTKIQATKQKNGYVISDETRKKLSENHSRHNLGKHLTEQQKINISRSRGFKPFKCIENDKIYQTIAEASKDLKISVGYVCQILNKTIKPSIKTRLHFEFVENKDEK